MEGFLAAGCAVLLVLSWFPVSGRSAPLPPAAAQSSSTSKKKTTQHKTHKRYHHRRRASRKRGQQKIDAGRTRDIQQALIRQHYLNGEPSGKWDSATQAALRRYQGDNGWQTKVVPDSRALIKMGLGPDQEHLLNPETAMTSVPAKPAATGGNAKPAANTTSSTATAASTPDRSPAAPADAQDSSGAGDPPPQQ